MSDGLKIRELSPALLEYAKKELGEEPKRRADDVRAIREWLKKQPHINAEPDDQMIITFLRGCKFRLEKTKQKLDMYYTMRSMCPELLGNRDLRAEAMRECVKVKYFAQLPGTDDLGRRVYVVKGFAHDLKVHNNDDVNKMTHMMMEYIMREDDVALIKGVVMIMDVDQISMSHLAYMTPAYSKKMTTIGTEAFPLLPKSVHFINAPSIFTSFFNFIKGIIKDKMKKRMFVHASMDHLYQQVPKRILPNEYGGEAGPFDEMCDEWIAKIEAYNDWYLSDDGFGVDEKKRPGKPKTQEDLFGVEGSFRKLEID